MRALKWRLLLTIHAFFLGHASSDGNVGCLFNENLCVKNIEKCYDDFVFGKCLQESVDAEDLYQYADLAQAEVDLLNDELSLLVGSGFKWNHAYTQCRIQALLYAIRHRVNIDLHICKRFVKASRVEESDREEFSKADEEYLNGNEFYYPKMVDEELLRDSYSQGKNGDPRMSNIPYNTPTRNDDVEFLPLMHRRANPAENKRNQVVNRYDYNRDPETLPPVVSFIGLNDNLADEDSLDRKLDEKLLPIIDSLDSLSEIDSTELVPALRVLNRLELTPDDINYLLKPENFPLLKLILTKTIDNLDADTIHEILNDKEIQDFRNKIAKIREDMYAPRHPAKKSTVDDSDIYEPRIYYDDLEILESSDDENDDASNGISSQFHDDSFAESLRNAKKSLERLENQGFLAGDEGSFETLKQPGIYTEGGVLYVPDSDDQMNWGFKRPERLDVKKPGPLFPTNPSDGGVNKKSTIPLPPGLNFSDSVVDYDVDHSYAYLEFKELVKNWNDGIEALQKLERLLKLPPDTLHYIDVEHHGVTFQVRPNDRYNATQLVKEIVPRQKEISAKIGFTLVAAGLGNKTRMPVAYKVEWSDREGWLVVKAVTIGGIFIVLLGVLAFLLKLRHMNSKQKVHDARSNVDSEASRDYQDLCRSRMSSKVTVSTTVQPIDRHEGGTYGRITSLSRESDQQSPSSRSSTSSWNEEPVITNMDISTGHMVLSYMEDHLKNKDRLEQEWVALCAYEAEPCSTKIAQLEENEQKNRYGHVIPYDHARIILGKLSNMHESDYINASSITDHDPRNPAYIATQGPIPSTTADFWQMVWEQGSVVMVMLTRLTENGKTLCHRYWPEEGSEVYHIYEVHLVSEHIWCDDYLVRSFYLKNVKTGETRTVTQFHFLSWPDNGVPMSTKALLEFRRKVNKSYRGRSCPIVVHCSDGAGRTGTYCLIDMVLNRMAKGAKEIDIAATLEHIRDQRPGMVATKQQFEFVLMAVAEEVHAILKALPAAIEKQEKVLP